MCMPRFLSRVLKRKKPKSKRVTVDVYQRVIIESPRTPLQSPEQIPAIIGFVGEEPRQWVGTPRVATPTCFITGGDTNYESKRARYGGNGSSREGNFPAETPGEVPVRLQESPDANPGRRTGSLARTSSVSQASKTGKPIPIRPPTPPRKRSASHHPRTQHFVPQNLDDHRRDCDVSKVDLNSRPLPPLPGTRTRSVTFTDRGPHVDDGSGDQPTRPKPKTEPSFEIPGSWDELARSASKSSPRVEDTDDLAIAIGVREMISSTPRTTASASDFLLGNATAEYTQVTRDPAPVLASPDSHHRTPVPQMARGMASSKEPRTNVPFPAQREDSCHSFMTNVNSPLPSPTSIDFTPRPRRRTDSSVYLVTPVKPRTPGRVVECDPLGSALSNAQNSIAFPLTPSSSKSPAKRPLPLTPITPSHSTVHNTTADAYIYDVAKVAPEHVEATVEFEENGTQSGYPTPTSSLGRK